MAKRWSDLSPGTRKVLAVAGALEGVLKAIALADLRRRPDGEVRGSKKAWAAVIMLVNGAGVAPLGYFLLGRRRTG